MDLIAKHFDDQTSLMLEEINTQLPEISRATKNFGKRQSQFMDNMLTLSHPTPIRNMRQIASEIERTHQALTENVYKVRKDKVRSEKLLRDAVLETDELDRKLMVLEAEEIKAGIENTEKYMQGAIRKIANYCNQYKKLSEKIMQEQGVSQFSELDFEMEEERYHIMTAFSQGITAARSRGGTVDEGNHIYFHQIGINGAVAQNEISRLFVFEIESMKVNREPSHDQVLQFLNEMAEKFKGCSREYAEKKGVSVLSENALNNPQLT